MGNYYIGSMTSKYSKELYHHGILGQKWGIRRFQNPDGSLTEEGRKRYGYSGKTIKNNYNTFERAAYDAGSSSKARKGISKVLSSDSANSKSINAAIDEARKNNDNYMKKYQKYSKRLEKELGRQWDGDGTEEHEALYNRYKEYRKASDSYAKSINKLTNSIEKASTDGDFDGIIDVPDYRDDNTSINGKSAAVGFIIAEKTGLDLFPFNFKVNTSVPKTGRRSTERYFKRLGEDESINRYNKLNLLDRHAVNKAVDDTMGPHGWKGYYENVNLNSIPPFSKIGKAMRDKRLDNSKKVLDEKIYSSPEQIGSAKMQKQFEKYLNLQGTRSLLGGDRRNDEGVKVLKDYQKELYSHRGEFNKKIQSAAKRDPDSVKDVSRDLRRSVNEKYYERYAKAVLKDMGYDVNQGSVAWLIKQPWFGLRGATYYPTDFYYPDY